MKKKSGWLLLAAVVLFFWLLPSPFGSGNRAETEAVTRIYNEPVEVVEAAPTPTLRPTPQPTTQPASKSSKPTLTIISTPEPTQPAAEQTYILNTNTHKFHYPWCSSVDQMKEKNKLEYTGDRDNIIEMGYVPCQRCRP